MSDDNKGEQRVFNRKVGEQRGSRLLEILQYRPEVLSR
jgi:hypothetical protein